MEEKIQEQSTIQASESYSVKNNSKSSKRFPIIIPVVFIALVACSALFYFLGKTQNANKINIITTQSSIPVQETAWKTYTNTKHNYMIDYPSDWSVNEYPDSKDGASFAPFNKSGDPNTSDVISISVGQALGNYANSTLEEYAKIAGKEIQNYNELATIKKITASNGAVGYQTTWMVQPITVMGRPPVTGESESLPIAYFEIPGNKTSLIRVTLSKKEDLATYEKMLTTIKIIASLTPMPTVDETAILKNVIKKYIVLKHNSNESSLTINVSKIEGNYAQGGALEEGGGAMWFAAKEDGVWKLVWDGNGTIECSTFTLYPNFPTSMIPECYDSTKQTTIKR